MSYTEEAYSKAVEVLKRCATPYGFFAAYPGYDAVWARDSMIISLGASLVKVPSFKETFAKSLITLAQHQSRLGQIPNAVDIFSKRKSHVDYASIDSTLWYITVIILIKRDITILRYSGDIVQAYKKHCSG